MANTCQQVVDDRTKRRCGKPARPRLRLGLYTILCDECAARAKRCALAAWGID
jgi:hypothetical protein